MAAEDHDQDARWIVHSERRVYDSDWVKVTMADISLPSGDRFEHHTVWFPPAAMIAVFDEGHDHVLLSWRHRFAPDIWNYELPGGIIEEGEDPAVAVAREVGEETGYRVRDVRHLITFEPAVGMLRNPNHVYVGQADGRIGEPTELNEGRFEWVPYDQVPKLIREGKIANSGTLVALLHLLALSNEC
jgi:8-oxo-dGTP pyrophosphatase MutT (NUDIX family)